MKTTFRWLEKSLALHPSLGRLYMRPYRALLQQESELAQIKNSDRMFLIGCGAIPFTAFDWVNRGITHITAIDQDETALKTASQLTKKMGIADLFQWQHTSAEAVDFSQCDVALITLQIYNKQAIYQRWLTQAPAGSRLLVRQPKPKHAQHYGQLPSNLLPQGSVSYSMQAFDTTLLFQKEGQA